MIVQANTPATGAPTRAIVLPRNGPIFGYWLIYIQVSQPTTINVGTNKREAGLDSIGAIQDGLQFAVANDPKPIPLLWSGELWVSASAQTPFVVVIPGMERTELPCDTTV